MATWVRSFVVVLLAVATSGCGATNHPSESATPDASAPDAEAAAPDAEADAAHADESHDAGDASAEPPDEPGRFRAIPLEAAGGCIGSRPGLAIGSPRRILVTTSCGFYAVDPIANEVVKLATQGEDIDNDGQTVAVIAGKLGLSLDGGETFAWIDWTLGRCQGTPRVSAGGGFTVVSCVAGVGRWRGRGSDFEQIAPSGSVPIVGGAAAGGSRLIIQAAAGLFASDNGGDSFKPLTITGLVARAQPSGMEIVDSTLWVSAQPEDATPLSSAELFAVKLGNESVARGEAFPEINGAFSLSYNDGVLLLTGVRTLLSTDKGASFAELKPRAVAGVGGVAKYAAGHLYRVVDGTLYVDTL